MAKVKRTLIESDMSGKEIEGEYVTIGIKGWVSKDGIKKRSIKWDKTALSKFATDDGVEMDIQLQEFAKLSYFLQTGRQRKLSEKEKRAKRERVSKTIGEKLNEEEDVEEVEEVEEEDEETEDDDAEDEEDDADDDEVEEIVDDPPPAKKKGKAAQIKI